MIRCGAALLCSLTLGLAPGSAAAQGAGRQVFTRTELEAAGIHRVSGLMEWLGGWSSSVNGLAWTLAPDALPRSALPRAGLPEWTLVVDGQHVDLAALGAWFPELSPVPVQQIDSVEVIRAPGLAGGAFASRGVLRVHTRRPPRGGSANVWYRTGSETGDAGPYVYTPLNTPNVDRTGHDMVGIVGYGGRGWDAQLSVRHITHPATDPPLDERYGTLEHQLFVYVRGPVLKLGADAFGGRHEVTLGQVDQEGFTYLPARGRMERSDVIATHAGAAGTFGWTPRTELAYRFSRSDLELIKRRDRLPYMGSDRRSLAHGSLELRHRFSGWQARAGYGADHRSLTLEQQGEDPDPRLQGTLFGELQRDDSALTPRLSAALVRVGNEVGVKAAADARWSIDSTRALVGSLSAVQHLPFEGSAWIDAWSLRGTRPAPPPRRTLVWSEVGWEQQVSPALMLEAGGVYGRITESASRPAASDAADDPAEGGRFGVRLGATLRSSSRFSGRLVYQSIAPVAASPALRRAMETISAHSLTGHLSYTPVPSLRLGTRVHFRSATDWGGASPSLVDVEQELEGISRLDLSVEKWMWKRRLRTQFQVRNVLDAPERYHPYGTDFDLRYFVGAELSLPPGT